MASPSATTAAASPLTRRLLHWLDAMPHPHLACEIASTHVAALLGTRGRRGVDRFAAEPLPPGVVAPSTTELNIADASAVRERLQHVLARVGGHGSDVALLVPDPVVRVFLLPFETFPRSKDEALPLLRWRLKKSVPFDVDDTVVSYMLQSTPPNAGQGLEVLAAIARRPVVRQYEEVLEAAGLSPGVVVSSTLATLAFLEDARPVLLARLCGNTLTTVIARSQQLCVYRCTEVPQDAAALEPQALLEEVYPAVTFYQDTWRESVAQVRLAGLGARYDEFRRAVETELGLSVAPLASPAVEARVAGATRALTDRQLEALVGWTLNLGA